VNVAVARSSIDTSIQLLPLPSMMLIPLWVTLNWLLVVNLRPRVGILVIPPMLPRNLYIYNRRVDCDLSRNYQQVKTPKLCFNYVPKYADYEDTFCAFCKTALVKCILNTISFPKVVSVKYFLKLSVTLYSD
jgi:hypothetical protein